MSGYRRSNGQGWTSSLQSPTALSIMNEVFGPQTIYVVNSFGPPHCPVFDVSVKVHGKIFTARGDSKQAAKQNVAMTVLNNKCPSLIKKYNLKWNNSANVQENRQNSGATKSALALLNEIEGDVHFDVMHIQGPAHDPVFKAFARVRGQNFSGCGKSKQLATQCAAQKILNSILDTGGPNRSQACSSGAYSMPNCMDVTTTIAKTSYPAIIPKLTKWTRLLIINALEGRLNMLEILNNLGVSHTFTIAEETLPGSSYKFVSRLSVGKDTFKGFGSNKKAAKVASIKSYLNCICENDDELDYIIRGSPSSDELGFTLPSTADMLAEAVLSKYYKLTKSLKDYSKRVVLAGICMTRNSLDFEVISLATGTKTISGSYLSLNGSTVNDCHAEVLARRGFLKFLYSQLLMASARPTKECIFKSEEDGGFTLKNDVMFHFYLSTAPCGDARLFTFNDPTEGADKTHPNRSQGQLRVKIESGMGTIKIEPNTVQTWDGIMMGDRLLTMSCSDKLLKWNVLGLQGTLLMHFIDKPLYADNLVVTSLYSKPHLERALLARIYEPSQTAFDVLPVVYSLNQLSINCTSSTEDRSTTKPPNHAINWNKADNIVEILNMSSGRTVDNKMSVLSKASLAKEFVKLVRKCNYSVSGISLDHFETYREAKLAAEVHQKAKDIFYGFFPKAGLCSWVKKPQDLSDFIIK